MKRPVLLFDFDDTLSEQSAFLLHYARAIGDALASGFGGDAEAWTRATADMLQTLEAQYVARFVADPPGYNAWYDTMHPQAMALVFGNMGLPVPPDAAALSRETQRVALAQCDATFEGARDAVRSLHASGYTLHLASGNDSGHLRGALAGAKLSPCFDRLFGPDLLDCAKEGPEYYVRVFHALDIAPADALVIDNDPAALAWALDVGARAIQADFLPHKPVQAVSGIAAKITDIRELPALVAQIEQDLAATEHK